MPSMVRTQITVPAGMVTYTGVFAASPTVPGWLESDVAGRVGISPAAISESNLSATMSASLYFCTDEPTWKVISLPVPPRNLTLDQAAVLQLQRVGPRDRRRQEKSENDQSATKLELHDDFSAAAIRLRKTSLP